MIAEICFTADWLDKKRKELKGAYYTLKTHG
jgi:hypothetical protein